MFRCSAGVARVAVKQHPRGKRHRDLVASDAALVVVIGTPHLVLQVVGHAVVALAHRVPELPWFTGHKVVRFAQRRTEPRHNSARAVQPHGVIDQPEGAVGVSRRRERAEQVIEHQHPGTYPRFGGRRRKRAHAVVIASARRQCGTRARIEPPGVDGARREARQFHLDGPR